MGSSKRRQLASAAGVPVTVILPLHVEAIRHVDLTKAVEIHVDIPRAVWHVLRPILFSTTHAHARRIAWLLFLRMAESDQHQSLLDHGRNTGGGNQQQDDPQELEGTILSRRFILPSAASFSPNNTSLLIIPPSTAHFDSSQEERFIHFENQLIRAQSMAGFLSTLGGGFFMCHHWRTAVAMARQQQQMARVLGDSNMYFKCLVNQAYNFIYAGKFGSAKALLRHILVSVKAERPSEANVLINMVASAMLFRKRVKTFTQQQKLSQQAKPEEQPVEKMHEQRTPARRTSKTFDDYGRIRVVKDESSADDIIRAFHGRAM